MSFLQPLGDLFNVLFKEPIYNVLILLYHVTSNFALSIVLLTILIRACLIPLTRKQLQSSRKMQELQPQIKALQAKYRGDPQGLMQAQRQLFKENNYSQAQGCLPLLIQMPMLYALFFSFQQLLSNNLAHINDSIYPFVPKLTALPDTLFLWMNLAHPDPLHILPILAGVLTFIQLRMAMPVRPKRQPGQPADATTQATQTTMYIMPVITIFFGLSFPSGMALYWCVGTLFMAVQQYFLSGWGSLFVGVPGMERFVPEPKIIPTLATATPAGARALTSARPATLARNGAAPAAETPAQPGGFRGMLKQLREQMQAVQRQTAEQQGAKNGTNGAVVDSTATVAADEDRPDAVAREQDRQRAARPRPSKQLQGPMLVKPAQRAEISPAAEGEEGAEGDGEAAEAAAVANGAASAPAPAPATPSTSKAGSARAPSGNAAGRAAGSATQIRPPAAGQRKGSGSGKGGPNSGRPRQNGRPKGGR